ncbi:hypothetical protein CTEN210_06623 [Chaetoceros tenuissimus]|uniref:Peptidase S1 domain-containing protein n=1 Tax=Chaetoceros tenuissimus TaxID=426638 RepID=A0AAD3H4C8_9STRA|nr:hypothetical protein CTEN210_06623 [Chaetoceros tenuissimus]
MKTTVGILLSLAFFQSAYAQADNTTSFHSPRVEGRTHVCFQKKYERSSYCKRLFKKIHKADEPQTSHIEERIIGGSDAPKDAYPWFAKGSENFFQPEFTFFCGGMLVAPDWILTAAHCTALLPVETVSFQIGALSNPIDGDNGGQYSEIFSAEYIVEFPDYNYYNQYDDSNDFALVKLKGHSTITPVDMDLTGITNSYDSDKKLWTLGFGALDTSYYTKPDWLQHVDLGFISQRMCKDKYKGLSKITDNMLCATGPDKDSCSGDSGGPLYDKENDKVVGVVSWGEGCADPQYPGVYAKISSQAEWIQETICSDTTDVEVLSFCEGYTNAPTTSQEPSISPTESFAPSISLEPTLSPSLSHVPTMACDDVPGWVDSLGGDCTFYDSRAFCEYYGNYYPGPSGLTANEACCNCGGGIGNYPTVTPTVSNIPSSSTKPSVSPSLSSIPTIECDDVPGWFDSYGVTCDFYFAEENCDLFGSVDAGPSGLTANDACCICGGGVGNYPTVAPTVSNAPTITCDDVTDWIDSYDDNCSWYDSKGSCESFGSIPGRSGLTANEACCICGGGIGKFPTATPTVSSVPTATPTVSSVPTVTCNDVIDWVDSNNLGCDAYLSDEVCEFFGDSFEGTSGLTANEACCKCGGGSTPTLSPVAQTDVKQSKSSKSSKSSLKSLKSNTKSSKASKASKKSTKASKSGKTV